MHEQQVGLGRTGYVPRIWPYIWWLPCLKYCIYVGLAKTIYIWCAYGILGREITKYMFIYGVYIRFWLTLYICIYNICIRLWPTLDTGTTVSPLLLTKNCTSNCSIQFEGSRTLTSFIEPLLPKNRTEQPWFNVCVRLWPTLETRNRHNGHPLTA